MKFFLRTILWLIVVALIVALAASFMSGYNASMSFLISRMHEEARADKILRLVSENKFLLLQSILFIATAMLIFLLFKFNVAWKFVSGQAKNFKASATLVFKDALQPGNRLVFILPFASYVFFAFYLPVAYDEASTYLNFTSRSPLVSMLYYPAPNNHILHSVITSFTKYIPFLGPLQCMRISSVMASMLTSLLLFSLVKKYYSVNSATAVIGISSVLFLSVYFSFASRGYSLVSLFFVLALYSVHKIIFENNHRRHWFYFSVFSALGFYAMPSFLYPYCALNLVLLLNNFRGIARQALFGMVTIIIVAMFYAPVIAVNGLDVLINNKQVQSATRAEVLNLFPSFASHTLVEVTGISFWLIASASLAALLLLIIQRKKSAIILAAAFIVTPLLLMFLHPVIPFARTFSYYCIVLPFICVIAVSPYLDKIPRTYFTAAVILVQAAFLYMFYVKMKIHKSENMQYAEINKNIAGNHSYYLNCKWYDAVLAFELKSQNFNGAVLKYNNPLVKVSADTIRNYDFIIIDKDYDETKTLTPLYSDKITNVYKR